MIDRSNSRIQLLTFEENGGGSLPMRMRALEKKRAKKRARKIRRRRFIRRIMGWFKP